MYQVTYKDFWGRIETKLMKNYEEYVKFCYLLGHCLISSEHDGKRKVYPNKF